MYKKRLMLLFTTISLILSACNSTFSQSKLKIGFDIRDEIVHQNRNGATIQYHSDKSYLEIPTFDFLALYNFSDNYSTEFKAGVQFQIFDSFLVGSNFGISLRRKILNQWLYGRFNFTLNLNKKVGHESITGGWSSYKGIFPMVGLGFDFYTSKNISFNISYFKLLKEKIKYDYDYQWNNKLGKIEKIVTDEYSVPYFIKLGFSFYWDIL